MNKNFMNRLTMLAVTLMASMACFAQGKGGEATGWTAAQFGPNYQELSYSVTTNTEYHEAVVTGFASYVVETPAIMDDPETYAPGDANLQIEKNTILINHFMEGGTSHDVYIPSVAASAFASVASDLAAKIQTIKIDFKENAESDDYTQDIPVVIGSSAFAGLTSVENVYSYTPGEFVKAIPTNAFATSVLQSAKLNVPAGSLTAYAKTAGWKSFRYIFDGTSLLGDLSGDKNLTNVDALRILKLIKDNAAYNPVADVNGDGSLTNVDVLLVLKKIKNI